MRLQETFEKCVKNEPSEYTTTVNNTSEIFCVTQQTNYDDIHTVLC